MEVRLLDVEDRPVALVRKESGLHAYVWKKTHWAETPALVGKSMVEGITLTPEEFATEFPEANVGMLSLEG